MNAEAKALVDGLDKVALHLGSPEFDRNAVSLLAEPLTHLEVISELIR